MSNPHLLLDQLVLAWVHGEITNTEFALAWERYRWALCQHGRYFGDYCPGCGA